MASLVLVVERRAVPWAAISTSSVSAGRLATCLAVMARCALQRRW